MTDEELHGLANQDAPDRETLRQVLAHKWDIIKHYDNLDLTFAGATVALLGASLTLGGSSSTSETGIKPPREVLALLAATLSVMGPAVVFRGFVTSFRALRVIVSIEEVLGIREIIGEYPSFSTGFLPLILKLVRTWRAALLLPYTLAGVAAWALWKGDWSNPIGLDWIQVAKVAGTILLGQLLLFAWFVWAPLRDKVEESAGVILFNRAGSEVLLVWSYHVLGWVLPKGHPKQRWWHCKEQLLQAALRELKEETGHVASEHQVRARLPVVSQQAFFPKAGTVPKRIVYFVVQALTDGPQVPVTSPVHCNPKWLAIEEIRTLRAGYSHVRPVLARAVLEYRK